LEKALTKVFISSETTASPAKYDYLVIDTAPTGHTIRLLAFPDFLSRLISKVEYILLVVCRFTITTIYIGTVSSWKIGQCIEQNQQSFLSRER